ncbi:MAG: hypothetical protein KF819_36525 [Labilithrix sp.]|nr:hypothetical protein [Labilithrix sp.]
MSSVKGLSVLVPVVVLVAASALLVGCPDTPSPQVPGPPPTAAPPGPGPGGPPVSQPSPAPPPGGGW